VKAFENLYDLHNHLLFGVDDGAKNSDDTCKMLQDAVKNHVKVIVATPHMAAGMNLDKYSANFSIVEELALQYGIRVLRGAEYAVRRLPAEPPYVTLGGSKNGAVLADFRIPTFPPEFQYTLDNIFNDGHQLIIAHPERSFTENMIPELGELAGSGVIYQITAASLLGLCGRQAYQMSCFMLEKSWAKIIASDAHDSFGRPSLLQEAYQVIARKYGIAVAEVLQENARSLIEEPANRLQNMPLKKRLFNIGSWFR